ncbi:MAG: VOC family protein [Nevskiales bacterium]|nr:VOC family protein [Nevskiales bacterium]
MAKIDALSYVVAECTDLSKWQHYAEQVMGAMTAPAPGGGLYVKLDEREFRILVLPGDADRYVASGWASGNAADFEAAVAAVRAAGVEVGSADAETCAQRRVEALVRFTDPSGNLHELSHGYTGAEAPFASALVPSGFKTGPYGVGHTVLPSLQFDASLAFFRDALGFGLSDVFNFQPGPDAPVIRIHFLHAASGRHHSLALAEMPSPSGCVHMMVEVNSLTDVGRAYDRRAQHEVKLMATLGEHENDHMTSFYMLTPSNFAMEYGWGGLIVDPATFQATETKQVSVWGHDFSVGFQ